MKIVLKIHGGLGNRLGPLFSLYKICKDNNIKLLVNWENESFSCNNGIISMKASFNDIFLNNNISFINETEFSNYKNNNNVFKVEKGYFNLDIFKKYETILFTDWFYLTSLDSNDIVKWKPYTKKMGLYYEDDYIKGIKSVLNDFQLVDDIKILVEKNLKNFSKNMLGIHVRGSDDHDDSYYRTSDLNSIKNHTKNLLFERIDEHVKNEDSKILLVTPHPKIEKEIIDKYQNNVVIIDKNNMTYEKNRSTVLGIKLAIVDLILYSKCNKLIGTAGSSYSFIGWLFSNCDVYETLLGQSYKV